MRRLRPLMGLAALAALVLIFTPAVSAQVLTETYDIEDSYDKTLPADDEVRFTWLVYNKDPTSILLQVSVDPTEGEEWTAAVEPRYIVLAPTESTSVDLVVRASPLLEDGTASYTVTFLATLADDPTVTETVTRTATLTLEAAPPLIPPENKILGQFDNPLPAPFNDRIVTFVVSLLIWVAIAGMILLIISPILHRYAKDTETEIDDIVLGIIRGPVFLLVISYGFIQSLAILDPPTEIINILFTVYNVLFILILVWLAVKIFRGIIISYGRVIAKRTETNLDDILIPVLNRVGTILIIVVGLASIAAVFGMDLTAFIAGMGVLGIAIAFAAQESLSSFFSGMFLMLDRPFKPGDLIEINGDRCRIEKVGLRSTRVYHRPSAKSLIIPNNKLAREMIINLVEPDEAIRQSTTVGVAYGSDVDEVKRVLTDATNEHPNVIKDVPRRGAYARLEEFGDSAMVFKVKFWLNDADKINRARAEVNEIISRRLEEAGIDIPFPTRTVTIQDWTRAAT